MPINGIPPLKALLQRCQLLLKRLPSLVAFYANAIDGALGEVNNGRKSAGEQRIYAIPFYFFPKPSPALGFSAKVRAIIPSI